MAIRTMRLRIRIDGKDLGLFYSCARQVARCRTMAMQLLRAADAERPTMIRPDHPHKKNAKGEMKPDWKTIFGNMPEMPPPRTLTSQLKPHFPELTGTMIGTISCRSYKLYGKMRIDILTGKRRVPEWRDAAPIPFRDGSPKLRWDGDGFYLVLPICPIGEHKCRRVEVLVESRSLPQAYLDRLHDYAAQKPRPMPTKPEKTVTHMPAILVYQSGNRHKRKWFVDIPFDVAHEDHPLDDNRELLVVEPHGELGFLRCLFHRKRGAPWHEDLEWQSALRAKEHLEERRNAIAAKYRCSAARSGRRGHGFKRVMEKSWALTKKRRDQQISFNNNAALKIVRTAIRWKCGTIRMEDLSQVKDRSVLVLGNWEYGHLNTRVADLCWQHGISFYKVKPAWLLAKEECLDGDENGRGTDEHDADGRSVHGGVGTDRAVGSYDNGSLSEVGRKAV